MQLCNGQFLHQATTSSVMVLLNVSVVLSCRSSPCVASDYKDWDTYHPSSTYAYNTSLSEETDETPFFLTYGHKPVTLPNVALLTPMIQSKSEDSYQEQLIGLIRTA